MSTGSSLTLVVTTIITIAVIGAFLLGGDNPPLRETLWFPKNTDIVLYWMYAILAITIFVVLVFVILQFFSNFKTDAKSALLGLGVIIAFIALFFITYTLGDPTSIPKLDFSASTASYNIPSWLKIADMFLYSIYIMFALTALAIIVGSVKKIFVK
jgi:hypothetical protein